MTFLEVMQEAWILRGLPPHENALTSAPSRFGLAALAVLKCELGRGETLANNEGPDLDRYRRGGPEGPWCAALQCYGIEEGAKVLSVPCPIRRTHNAKELWRRIAAAGCVLDGPQLGAFALYHRGAAGAKTGHICIVSAIGEKGAPWTSIDGNKGSFPSKVRPYPHELGEPGFIGFARLP
jgi:hypothetical protein